MTIPVDLQKAKFGDTEFLVRSIRTEGGQKTVVHEFPGSDRRSVQELGQLPDSFTVSAIITGDDISGDSYTNAVTDFKRLLTVGGDRDFVHPSQGTFRVKVTTWSLAESDSEKGIANFEINFLTISQQDQTRAASGVAETKRAKSENVSAVSRQTERTKSAVQLDIEERYEVITPFRGNFTDATNQMNEIADEFLDNARQFTPVFTELSAFVRDVEAFQRNANRLVLNSNILGDGILALFDAFDEIQLTRPAEVSVDRIVNGTVITRTFRQETSLSQLNVATPLAQLITFFDFGDDDIPNRNNTAGLINRTNNRDILRTTIQTVALAEAYREASLIDFQTVDDINETNTTLDQQYQKVKNLVDDTTKEELSLLRSAVRRLFDNQRLTTSEVIELTLPVLPAIVQAQLLYGSDASDLVAQLIAVNGTVDTSTLGGPATKVLTQ